MIVIVLAAMALIVSIVVFWGDDYMDFGEKLGGTFMVTLVGLLFGGIIATIAGGIATNWQHEEPANREYIKSASDKIGTTGGFFLGTGMIDSELNYFFYAKTGEGYKARKVSSESASIVEDELDNPYIQHFDSVCPKSILFFDMCTKDNRQEIHVPIGTVIGGYKLDLE